MICQLDVYFIIGFFIEIFMPKKLKNKEANLLEFASLFF